MKRGNFLIWVLGLVFVMLGTMPLASAIPATERAALIAFYHSTNGAEWFDSSGWKSPPLDSDGFALPGTEGNWNGITVTGDHVTHLEMMYNNLNGPLPPELGDLSELRILMVADNYTLSGQIPPEIGKLSKLELFQASVNQLSGPIPKELGNLISLKYLRLYANMLSGPLPSQMGNLVNLEDMLMASNKFTGSIPASFSNLNKLESLDFDRNNLNGTIPPELGAMTNLRYLGLGHNALKGEIPSSLLNLVSADIHFAYNALYTNDNNLRAFLDSHASGWESSQTIAPTHITITILSPVSVDVRWTPIAYDWDNGGYKVFYRNSTNSAWMDAGITTDKTVDALQVDNLEPGKNYCFKICTQTYPHSQNENVVSSEFSTPVCTVIGTLPPFGSFDTPLNNAIVMSSIPVTGWALDDFGVSSVKIYRKAVPGEPHVNGMVFIGDADIVEGARPDVEAAYPDYPNNNRAGWGYMLLTNTLPNGGNGTFILFAYAADVEGNSVSLGKKTIICDNIDAVKPFGAIDTPSQGGIASGNAFVNFGWVLSPLPNTVPADGSTITVWVDGIALGNPVYNRFRADIAALFPELNNSGGAAGYFYLDTTKYANGAHTIQWTAQDDAGNSDGIGSRYFTIQNPLADSQTVNKTTQLRKAVPVTLSRLPLPDTSPVFVQSGYGQNQGSVETPADTTGVFMLNIPEAERLEIQLGVETGGAWSGYSLTQKGLLRLPIGSSLDHAKGVFYWQPCAGFLGKFRLIFFHMDSSNGLISVKRINIHILPATYSNKLTEK